MGAGDPVGARRAALTHVTAVKCRQHRPSVASRLQVADRERDLHCVSARHFEQGARSVRVVIVVAVQLA
ncbi:hypothetical protein XHV734_0983 [Xanthomonas hortorum pv. vitians]|nr:hypothetical protein XHV734_0983 [Xanthomonas hortorum pv. vitians]